MKKNKLFLLSIIALLFIIVQTACEKQIIQSENNISQNDTDLVINVEKENLQKTAEIVTNIFMENTKLAKNIIFLISNNDIQEDKIDFKTIFQNDLKSEDIYIFKQLLLDKFKNNSKNNHNSNIEQYLIDNNTYLYEPFPVEDYTKNKNTITIVAHPVDNTIQNEGIRINLEDSNIEPKKVLVDNDYAEEYPVLIIMPNDDIVEKTNDSNVSTSKAINEVKIGYIYVRDYCGGIFEGALELHFLRSQTTEMFNGTRWYVTGKFSNIGTFKLARKYVRYAKKGWQKGWVQVNLLWDSNWNDSKVQQVFTVYEYDKQKEITIGATAKTTSKYDVVVGDKTFPTGSEVPISISAKFYSDNDVFGVQEWNRAWFYKTNIISNGNVFRGSWKYDGWTIRSLSNNFWFTIPTRNL